MKVNEFTSEFRRLISIGYHTIEIQIQNSNLYVDDFYFIPEGEKIRLLRKTWIIAVVSLDDIYKIDGYYDGVDIQ